MPAPRRLAHGPYAPMLAAAGPMPAGEQWAFEVKWDGVRAVTQVRGGLLSLTSRGGQDLTVAFPELAGLATALGGRDAVLDGELIAFDGDGRQRFDAIQRRLRTTGPGLIARLARECPATYAIFDLLELDGEPVAERPWHERRGALDALGLDGAHWQVPPVHRGAGDELLAATAAQQLEGIIAKRVDSPYRPGVRSSDWVKIKHRARQEVVIGGWTPGSGQRANTIGALQVGVFDGEVLRRVGGVGSGLTDADLKELRDLLLARDTEASPFGAGEIPPGTRFAAPELVCEVEFSAWSDDGQLRHPVFRGLRSDLDPRDVHRERAAHGSRGAALQFEEQGPEPVAIVEGRRLRVSSLEKPMYGEAGFSKREVLAYYAQIAPVLLPHLAGRALTLRRFPHGAADPLSFFEKRASPHRPEWVQTVTMPVGEDEQLTFVEAADAPTLVWLANLATLELHPSLSLASAPEHPTALVFDLDPGAPASIVDCCVVALEIRALLGQLGLDVWAKTSGGKGLQLYAGLSVDVTYDDTKPFAHAVAALLEERHPDRITSRIARRLRGGKVLIDWGQNDRHKTTVAPYSLRARALPTVSTPVTWDEVAACADAADPALLIFTAPQVLERVARDGDLFAPVRAQRQSIPALGI